MLGDVARWLRILGEDCLYALPTWTDDEVRDAARTEDRVIVTRDTHLANRARREALRAVEVPQEETEAVLLKVYRALGMRPDRERLATRCAQCNGPLETTDAEGATQAALRNGKEPPLPAVAERHERFWTCLECGQPYWQGTHWENIEATRNRIMGLLGA